VSNPDSNTPKRMLALDGGGVRGILSLAYLEVMEKELRTAANKPDLVLADYFDCIGGTSTGAIIAAALAKGDDVASIQTLYRDLANDIFKPRFWRRGLLVPKFGVKALKKALDSHFQEMTFSDPEVRTGLMITAKRWDTNSAWVLHNSPNGRYWKFTKDYRIKDVVRASSAAPSYFRPQLVEVKQGQTGAFVDGGVTPHNNPALLMFLLSQVEGHGLCWPLGKDNLMIVSVGTGSRTETRDARSWAARIASANGITSLQMMMDGADELNRTLLQLLSDSPTAEIIDKEQSKVASSSALRNMLTYLRYNVRLESKWLEDQLGLSVSDEEAKALSKLDSVAGMSRLEDIGRKGAKAQLDLSHFI